MNIYQELVGESSKLGEKNDCGVKALSVITGNSYTECHKLLAQLGRKKGRETLLSSMFKALQQMGFKAIPVECPYGGIRSLGRNLPSKGSFLIFATNHFAGVRDGKIHDWSEGRCLRIKKFYQIVKEGEFTPVFKFKEEGKNKRNSFKLYHLTHCSGKVVAKYRRFPTKIHSTIKRNGLFKINGSVIKAEEFTLEQVR